MSIRLHLIALVVFCAIGGLALGVFLIDRQYAFRRDDAALVELRTQMHDAERLEDQTKQLLISVDILFGYEETYLLSSSRSAADRALTLAETLANRSDTDNRATIKTIVQTLNELQTEIDTAEKAAIRPSFAITGDQLELVDSLSRTLVDAVTRLHQEAATTLNLETASYEQKRSEFDVLAWAAIIAYLFSLLASLWLSSRAVSAPLAALSASAHRALSSDSGFDAQPAGPTEVRQLAESIGEFVDSLEHQNAQGNALLEAIPDALFVVDKYKGIVKVKPGSDPEVSAADAYVASSSFEEFLTTDQGAIAQQMVRDCLSSQAPHTVELRLDSGDSPRIIEARASAINANEAVIVLRDLTQKREVEARIRHMAYHDSLTGLLNRRAFKEAIGEHIETAEGQPFALFFVDADRFKVINDTHGHDMGDEVLKHITRCIQNCLRASDTLSRKATEEHNVSARMGGDEFVVLLQGVRNAKIAERVAQRLQEAVALPLVHDGVAINTSVTIGAALYPEHGKSVEELMQNADAAMYEAKRSEIIQYCVYDEQLAARNRRRLDIESKLSRAITQQDLFLVYQPKIDLQTRKIIGAEALVRWKDGDNYIPPNEFIPIAESTGLIIPLGEIITAEAINQMASWRTQGFELESMAINVSAAQLAHPRFYESVLKLAEAADVPNSALNIEITESLMLTQYERSIRVLGHFKEGGFSIALDDFGTGYSSLSYLNSDTEQTIIATIIKLGKTLGMRIVAEGVENQQQADFLQTAGCDQAQGYYFSKPVAPEEMAELMRQEQKPHQIEKVGSIVDGETKVRAVK